MRVFSSAPAGIAVLGLIIGLGLPCAADPPGDAMSAPPAAGPTIVLPGQEHYVAAPAPFPNGVMVAVLAGDPTKPGEAYTVRLKVPDGVSIPVHTHGGTENVYIVSGTLMVGLGSTFDASKIMALNAGAFASVPANLPHYAMAKGATVLDISGVGPESTVLAK